MAGKCQRQLLDLRKAHQLEPTNNNSNKPTSSISGGEDKYNISLPDLMGMLRTVPCWNRRLQELESFVEKTPNLLASCKPWAFFHNRV
ncbi:hypothetical protein FRACYDRAFT_269949 [Fragilariopsis cylindrus CCMP1102]|uniref:Uncharacterized protein n=1 Tax=Fragilariopsis cylindrus CCMP1102 TaxID=635003 RepID=A0A1E7F6N8_9STRA|nr:hypothetical protein FRACYDRAFT_269949 [Fragilariopsis cylindrus CCMP1102]|eukprot:OEU13852.1 hypothetical protein FRACYDRAFT_269949 [Fragilariopsis cylindrus CCMP1102]